MNSESEELVIHEHFEDSCLSVCVPFEAEEEPQNSARSFHQRDEAQCAVLTRLRAGDLLKKSIYESEVCDGSRLAPVIEQLRNAHGFLIKGDGSVCTPYFMPDMKQMPSLARVTPEMRSAYYTTPHWESVRSSRFEHDSMMCVLCGDSDELQCHHVTYQNIFREQLSDLLTVCSDCHRKIHKHGRLKFPSGISVECAAQIGWNVFEEWLLP
jgi:hypothetical protein